MKKLKKTISLMLALAVILSLFPLPAINNKITANAIVFFFVHKKNTDIISATGKTLRRLFPSAKKY